MRAKKITKGICGILILCLLGAQSSTVNAAYSWTAAIHATADETTSGSSKEDLEAAEDELAEIQVARKSAQKRLNSLKADKADIVAYIQELDQNLLEVQETIDQLSADIVAKEEEITATEESLVLARQTEEKQYEAMKLRIQFMYESGDNQYLELLFEAKSLADFLNQAEYIQAMMEYDRQMLAEYQETCQEIADTEAVLEQELEELEVLKEVNEQSKADLEELMEVKNQELEEYTAKINSAQNEVNNYAAAEKEKENRIEEIEAEIKRQEEANKTPETNTEGFIWPIPDSTRITSKFGPRTAPVAGASNYHKGVDVGAPTGTKIYAAASGTVVIAEYNYSAGNYILINHGNGLYTVYMHCSKLLVKVGDKVNQGDNIGLVGSTGYSTGPHLHFGVRVNGVYQDPLNYVTVPN